jgi:hypothetical protein
MTLSNPQEQEELLSEPDGYLTQLLDALARDDKDALRSFGRGDGFVHNSIRRLVWYVPA